jgi:hypothetical protein
MGEGVLQMIKACVTSFMDDPLPFQEKKSCYFIVCLNKHN